MSQFIQESDLAFNIVLGLILITLVYICRTICRAASEMQPSQRDNETTLEMGSLPPYLVKELEKTTPIDRWRGYSRDVPVYGKRQIPGVSRSVEAVKKDPMGEDQPVKALRGGEFIGNRMRFKVKVLNESAFTITDVKVFLISYPSNALRLVSEDDDAYFSKIEPRGIRSPSFDFLPTQDCVKGEISAGVSYVDMKGQPHTLTAKPFIIRSVCDLLIPDQIDPQEFALKLKKLECGEVAVKVTEWTPEEMFEKALHLLGDSNFYEVSSDIDTERGIVHAKVSGYAKGKYTGKNVAVELDITGPSGKRGAKCKIRVSGEDQAMILPAIDDLQERLNAWLCPMCSSPLTLANVEDLKAGKVVVCPFCNVSIGR
jgi:hypothetical protein